MRKPVYVLNGPNLDQLGHREPAVYGTATLDEIRRRVVARGLTHGLAIDFRQTNQEGELIGWVHEARETADGIVINPGGLTTTSVALLDALVASERPYIEVHLTNIQRRESFRHHSYVSNAAIGVICGLGPKGYEVAIEAMSEILSPSPAGT